MHHLLRVSALKLSVQRQGITLFLGISVLLGTGGITLAAIAPDVQNTRHNLSVNNAITAGAGSSFGTTVKATSETQVCVFCHTPHASTSGGGTGIVAPLWNRTLSGATYTFYTSNSLDASPLPGQNVTLPGVGVGSKLCLSCHDGTLAIGTVGVLNNAAGNIAMQGTDAGGVMASGSAGATTGFTRKIGTDLTNDHPISFTYDAAQATRDGELYTPGGTAAVGSRTRTVRPTFPLVAPLGGAGSQLECITCHDPHLKTDQVVGGIPVNNKFLRGNRFQGSASPTDGSFNPTNDIMCLACHTKAGWGNSTHGNSAVTSEQFTTAGAQIRDFPIGTQVWQAACLACHDVHTVPGSRRLLREATDSATSPKTGGASAIEEACFQCHTPSGTTVVTPTTSVPDIKTDFGLNYHMPIVTAQQGKVPTGGGSTGNTVERHDIGGSPGYGKDLREIPALLGAGSGNLINRHAECPDCHNPHRLTKTHLFNTNPTTVDTSGTHNHTSPHSNIASGVLRGGFGVEPQYSSASFYSEPSSFVDKFGDGGPTPSNLVTSNWVTREYQICAKCHSNYGFGSLVGTIANPSNIPPLGRAGGTPNPTNGLHFYTNVFREIQAPSAHRGEGGASGGGASYGGANHRSWHPVLDITGRTPGVRNASAGNWLAPWTNDVGNLTMYCTDCHGSSTPAGVSNQAVDGPPEGPHGSTNIFILKGWWDTCTGTNLNVPGCLTGMTGSEGPNSATRVDNDTHNDLCFKCHDYNVYAGGNAAVSSGFGTTNAGAMGGGGGMAAGAVANLHAHHVDCIQLGGGGGAMGGMAGGGGGGGGGGGAMCMGGGGGAGGGGGIRCMWCHVAVPHGWKNKALLVNLNDVGNEANCRAEDTANSVSCTVGAAMAPGTQVRNNFGNSVGYTNPPYYRTAMLKVVNFATSGNWAPADCGSAGAPGNGLTGACGGWMTSNEGCSGPP